MTTQLDSYSEILPQPIELRSLPAEVRPEPVEGRISTSSGQMIVQSATGLLSIFNRAGILTPADVHTAETVCRIGHEADENIRLALALTVRALRKGSVCIDLSTVRDTAFDEAEALIDLDALPWPDRSDIRYDRQPQ